MSLIFVLLLFRGADFVGYSSTTYSTSAACEKAARALPQHRGQCIRLEIR